ncbi:MAG TPA: enoyl-CoA hydratase, partial [Mycobacterium sp.]|nr:enoyl-CoA hydratase [Mycobacterium sp.]HQE16168.1 enoyl-CoA hydratase [Mycobacterium sp.]
MSSPLVRYTVDGAAARLTLDSPHNRNALSSALVAQLRDGLRRAEADPA